MSHTPITADPDLVPVLEERANHCFGCGPANPQGLHLNFTVDAKTLVATATLELTRVHEGPPGYVHGGIVATLLDEAMAKLNSPMGVLAVTRHIEIDYMHPVPLHQPLVVEGHHVDRPATAQGRPGRKLFHRAEIRSQDGTVLTRAKGLFIVLSAAHLQGTGLPSDVRDSGQPG
ncbi:MAG: PaaI family thioesterase [Acidobacteriota bacterium]|nr:PaaI family thioesterase [Acidobacteriota bacterium]